MPSPKSHPGDAMTSYPQRSPHILFVEDDRDLRDSVTEVLEQAGYSVTPARDGAHALACLRRIPERPDLILLDIQMPNMDGYEFRREQLRSPEHAAIPVAVISADENAKDKMASLGLEEFLRKPITIAELLKLTTRVLGSFGSMSGKEKGP